MKYMYITSSVTWHHFCWRFSILGLVAEIFSTVMFLVYKRALHSGIWWYLSAICLVLHNLQILSFNILGTMQNLNRCWSWEGCELFEIFKGPNWSKVWQYRIYVHKESQRNFMYINFSSPSMANKEFKSTLDLGLKSFSILGSRITLILGEVIQTIPFYLFWSWVTLFLWTWKSAGRIEK